MTSPKTNFQRLNRKVFPAGINSYYRCPRKFEYRYFSKPEIPYQFKPAVAFGGAAHKVLAGQLRARMEGTTPQDVRVSALDYLTRESAKAPDQQSYLDQNLDSLVEHVGIGLSFIPDDCTIVAVERRFSHWISLARAEEQIELCAQVDLVFSRSDGTVEHVDFKTGKQAGDLFQNFICRTVVASELQLSGESLLTSNIMTGNASYISIPSDRGSNEAIWLTIRETLDNLAKDTEWRAKPEPSICKFCDFNTICEHADLGADPDGWSGGG